MRFGVIVLTIAALPLLAQSAATAASGERVRVTGAPVLYNRGLPIGKRLSGVFVAQVGDTLLIARERSDTVRVSLLDIARLEVARGRRRQFGHDTFVGILTGAAFGAAINPLLGCYECDFVMNETAAAGAVLGGITGLVIARRPRTNWVRVDLNR